MRTRMWRVLFCGLLGLLLWLPGVRAEDPVSLKSGEVDPVDIAPEVVWYKVFQNDRYAGYVRSETKTTDDGNYLFRQVATYPRKNGKIEQIIQVRFTKTLEPRGFEQTLKYPGGQKRETLGAYDFSDEERPFLKIKVNGKDKGGYKVTGSPLAQFANRFILLQPSHLQVGKAIKYDSFSTTARKFVESVQRVIKKETIEVEGKEVEALRVESTSEALPKGGRFVMWALPVSDEYPNGRVLRERQETKQGERTIVTEVRLSNEKDARSP